MFSLSFFSRKLGATVSPSGTTDTAPATVPVPSSPESEPPITPSPSPQDLITDPNPLHDLIASVPAQTLHAYILAHLIPPSQPLSPLSFPHIPLPSEPPSHKTLTALTNFFSNLVPPPRLHCVRCHKGYFEVENTDRSCLVPHDDESAEVERVGVTKGTGTEYETLWGCCGKTVEGDGDMGPPDGWCYEGKHTTDLKRARFRADSTLHNDKLTPCERLRCNELPSSSPRATRGGANKRRRALIEEADNEDARSSPNGSTASSSSSNNMLVDDSTPAHKPKRVRHSKSISISSNADLEKSKADDLATMDVDSTSTAQAQVPVTPKSPTRSRKSRKSSGGTTTPGTKPKAKSPLASSFTPPSPTAADDTQRQSNKEKVSLSLPRPVVEITRARDGSPRLVNSTSQGDLRKDSYLSQADKSKECEKKTQSNKEELDSRPRTRRSTAADTSAPTTPKASSKTSTGEPRSTKKPASAAKSSGALKTKSSAASLKSKMNMKPASSTASTTSNTPQKPVSRAGSTRKKGRSMDGVVATSVDGEEENL